MFKRFDKIKILGLVTATFLISCTQEAAPGASSFDNFTEFAAMDNYRSPIYDNTTLHLVDNGSIMAKDKAFAVYSYVEQFEGDNSKAIYNAQLPGETLNRFFVVNIIGTGKNKVLEFVFDEEVSGGYYWTNTDDINLRRSQKDNVSVNQVEFLDLAPKTKYIYTKDDSYVNLLKQGTLVYYHDESIVIFEYTDIPVGVKVADQAIYKSEGNNYLGVEIVGEGDNKDLRFYFNNHNNESKFWSKGTDVRFDEDHANVDVFPKTFIDYARKDGYEFALEDSGANIHDNGTITNSTDTKALFTYLRQDNLTDPTKAIYKDANSGELEDKYVGIKISGNTNENKKLNIYFKNKENVVQFWDHTQHVEYVDEDDSVLATRFVGMEGGTAKVVGGNEVIVPNSEISTLIADNVTYVLSQTSADNITLSYTIDKSDNPKWDSSTTAGYKVISSSLQSIGKDILATVINNTTKKVTTLKLKPGLSPVSSIDSGRSIDSGSFIDVKRNVRADKVTGLVTVTANDKLYVASSGSTEGVDGEETIITGGEYVIKHDQDIVQTIVVDKNELFTAGLTTEGGNKFSVSTSFLDVKPTPGAWGTEITGTGLPPVDSVDTNTISLAYAGGRLYAVTTVSSGTDIYLYNSNSVKPAWTKQILPTITGAGFVDAKLISKGDNLYFLYNKASKLILTPLRITESGSLAAFAGEKTVSIEIPIGSTVVVPGITIVDNSDKVKAVNLDPYATDTDKVLPTGDIHISYISDDGKLKVMKLNMKDGGAFKLAVTPGLF